MTIIRYHVFADNKDDFFKEEELEQAVVLYQEHADDGMPNVRLYKEVYENEQDYENDFLKEENSLLGTGGYPL